MRFSTLLTTPTYRISKMLLAALALASCATPYKPNGAMGGFSEHQMAEDVFTVSFQGNGYTDDARARDFLMLRCAEVTLSHGMKYFRLVGSADDSKNGAAAVATGNTAFIAPIHFPHQTATIQIRDTREGPQDFDAAIASKSIREQYGIK